VLSIVMLAGCAPRLEPESLQAAARRGDLAEVKRCLKRGTDPEISGRRSPATVRRSMP